LAAAAGVSCALVLAGAEAAGAHGAWPYHDLGPTYCVDGRMEVYPPRDMRSSIDTDWRNPEQVWWSPDLYRYNRRQGRWRRVYIGDWYYGFAHSYGLIQNPYTGTRWNFQDDRPMRFVPITINRPGRYRISHFMEWGRLEGIHRQQGGVCRYTA
jgi:hypothetical protein